MRTPFVIPARWDRIVMLVLFGVFGCIAQVLLTMGLRREAAGRASLALYLGIIYALGFEKMFFDVTPSALSMCGTAIIIGCAVFVALTKTKTKTKQPTAKDSALEQGLLGEVDADDSSENNGEISENETASVKVDAGKDTSDGDCDSRQ